MSQAEEMLDRVLDPLSQALTPEVARRFISLSGDPRVQQRIEYLAGRCNEGLLTREEQEEYEAIVAAIDIMAILRAKARAMLSKTPAA